MLHWNSPLLQDSDLEQQFGYLRTVRDRELAATDWTQLPDAPCDKQAWAEYRQALRDLPAQHADPKQVVFPTRPN